MPPIPANVSARDQFPIYYHDNQPEFGTEEARVEVGRWTTIYPPGSQGSVFKAQVVRAYGRRGQDLYRENVTGHNRFDPESRNQLGQFGAVRTDPPTAEEVNAAIERALSHLVAEENLLRQAPPVRTGWSEWEYTGYDFPHIEQPQTKRRRGELCSTYIDPRSPTGDSCIVTGRGNAWRITTDATSGPGASLYYDTTVYPSADAAQLAVERTLAEG